MVLFGDSPARLDYASFKHYPVTSTVPRLDLPGEAPSAHRKDRQDEVTEPRYWLFKVHGPQAHLIQ